MSKINDCSSKSLQCSTSLTSILWLDAWNSVKFDTLNLYGNKLQVIFGYPILVTQSAVEVFRRPLFRSFFYPVVFQATMAVVNLSMKLSSFTCFSNLKILVNMFFNFTQNLMLPNEIKQTFHFELLIWFSTSVSNDIVHGR